MRFSALEFLTIKATFEMKKAMDRQEGKRSGVTMPPIGEMNKFGQSASSPSAASFVVAGTLPRRDSIVQQSVKKKCNKCDSTIKASARFCTNCGTRIS